MDNRKRVLVTGAGRGIGKAIASQLGMDGFEVVLHYRKSADGVNEAIKNIKENNSTAYSLCFDVCDRENTQKILDEDIEKNGSYYGVVCNAGITADAAFPMMSSLDWDNVIDTNLTGFFNVVHPCIMPMIAAHKGGRIIAISSVSGIIGNRGQVNYSASKAGLIGAVKALAVEVGKRNITVNAIAPGLIETDMAELDETVKKEILKLIPLKRMGQVQEVASLASFLMSDNASYITRQVISIDGGMQ
ncbi:3-oxoacyl-[acyl-carrier protein] reductase [Succinivibrio dextrinosolvens DSM 3072]|uniref:3-oxoacyl-[acyl-carrier protein] reductase n=1 Tax=Succinivibrio dextrinosolvens DSM 3072 TaxID=1123324 RepID=A0A1T4V700_9GAMM|nr:3-oxoacyl-ACP reductase FabG [Succinivibrio dextrinosolvens]SKA60632.1 3-oxoacyl-[acyl-carrier protein] reductase [Succinivibrio dextrinosolvens DSM 3072]